MRIPRAAYLLALACLAAGARGDDRRSADDRRSDGCDRLNRVLDACLAPKGPDEGAAEVRDEPEDRSRRRPIAALIGPIDLTRLQRRFDSALGFDRGDESDKPEAPDISEPVFVEFIRPLGSLKYESEVNYLVFAPTGKTPMSQFLEYEYVFADWKALKFEMEFSQGVLETIEPGYQRTLGVGRRGNWVHGFQVNPEVFVRTGFFGGTAVYMLGWKPDKESPFSTSAWLGANRSQFDASPSKSFPTAGGGGLSGLGLVHRAAGDPAQRGPGALRTLANLDFGYELSPKWNVGIENDAFIHPQFGEYLVLPHINWKPSDYVFIQLGAGYYQLGHERQGIAMVHVNLVQPSTRKARRPGRGDR